MPGSNSHGVSRLFDWLLAGYAMLKLAVGLSLCMIFILAVVILSAHLACDALSSSRSRYLLVGYGSLPLVYHHGPCRLHHHDSYHYSDSYSDPSPKPVSNLAEALI